MGTRADFYVKQLGTDALEWLSSIAWDGYPDGISTSILESKEINEYLRELKTFLDDREDVTYSHDGWPWPWNTSAVTDFTYLYDELLGKVLVFHQNNEWFDVKRYLEDDFDVDEASELVIEAHYTLPEFDNSNPVLGNRSGLLIFGV